MSASTEYDLLYGHCVGRVKKDGRIKIPSRFFKTAFKNSGTSKLVLTLSPNMRCIELRDMTRDRELSEHVSGSSEKGALKMHCRVSSVVSVGVDDRLRIPSFMRACAGLGDHVVFLGAGRGFEIWDPATLYADANGGGYFGALLEHLVETKALPAECLNIEAGAGGLVPLAANDGKAAGPVLTVVDDPVVGETDTDIGADALAASDAEEDQGTDDDDRDDTGGSSGPDADAEADDADCADGELGEAGFDVPIDSMTVKAGGCALVYRVGLDTLAGRSKRVRYISPTLTLDGSQWVIVVTAATPFRAAEVRPMWRDTAGTAATDEGSALLSESDEGAEDELVAAFPRDWRDFTTWADYDPHNRETHGLPAELEAHYRACADEITAHANHSAMGDVRDALARLGSLPARLKENHDILVSA